MVSLLKALHASQQNEYEHSLLRAPSRVIEGIGENAINEASGDLAAFQRTIRELERRLIEAHGDAPETLLVAGQVLQAMSLYNRETTRRQQASIREPRDVVSMMTGALEYACKGRSAPPRISRLWRRPSRVPRRRTTFA
jgi:hypothetical protein